MIKQIRLLLRSHLILLVTRMITDFQRLQIAVDLQAHAILLAFEKFACAYLS